MHLPQMYALDIMQALLTASFLSLQEDKAQLLCGSQSPNFDVILPQYSSIAMQKADMLSTAEKHVLMQECT